MLIIMEILRHENLVNVLKTLRVVFVTLAHYFSTCRYVKLYVW